MAEDFLPLLGTDHIEFWVGNAKQASYFYQHAFGFEMVAYSGPETGVRDRASYVLQQGKIRFVFTTPMGPNNEGRADGRGLLFGLPGWRIKSGDLGRSG